jgi:hypothetical protein
VGPPWWAVQAATGGRLGADGAPLDAAANATRPVVLHPVWCPAPGVQAAAVPGAALQVGGRSRG